MWVGAPVLALALHGLGCLAEPVVTRLAHTSCLFSRHPFTAQNLPHISKNRFRLSRFLPRRAEGKSAAFTDPVAPRPGSSMETGIRNICGRNWVRTSGFPLVRRALFH